MSDYHLVRAPQPAAAALALDAAQRQIVDHDRGRLLVLAGPGTGKTATLVEAVAARVDRGVPVEHILMLTFSRRAANEMRNRVAARLGRTIREPIARTLHSYAFGVLRMANLARGLPDPRLFAAAEQDLQIRELLPGRDARWPAELAAALGTRAFAGELRDLLLRAVERGLDGPALAELGRRHGRPDWVAAGAFLREYHEVTALADPGGYDPAELIRGALRGLLDDPALLRAERAQRRRIFVDEYQDTDPAQAELLSVLAAGCDELILVGDPDQSIYAFRGADDTAMREAPDRFAIAETVALGTCRRSGRTLLDATRRVAERLPGPAAHRALQPAAGLPRGALQTAVFRSASEEAAFIAATLRREHLDGTPWSRMAVLVRSTATTLSTLERAMVTAGVPVAVRGDEVPLAEQPAVAALLQAVKAAGRLHAPAEGPALRDDDATALLLGPIGGGDAVYLRRLHRELRRDAGPDAVVDGAGLAGLVSDLAGVEALPAWVRDPVRRVAVTLAAGAAAIAAGGSAEDVLWAVWQASGLAPRWSAASQSGGSAGAAADRDLDAVVALFEAAARYTDRLPHESVEGFTAHLAAQQIPADPLSRPRAPDDAVAVLTAHASKGLEWDVVCVARVQEGSWPDLRRRGSLLGTERLVDVLAGRDATGVSLVAPQLAEERRLFYVAATRARRRLLVSAVSDDDDQPSRFLDELDPQTGDRVAPDIPRGVHLPTFVAELRAAVCDPAAPARQRTSAAVALARLAAAQVAAADPREWWGLAPLSDDGPLVDVDEPVTVSPSKVESFLRCELRTVLTDLGAKNGDQLSASIGTLVHAVAAEAPPDATPAQLEALLAEGWAALDFPAGWFEKNERRRAATMITKLAEWLAASRSDGLELLAREEPFEVDLGTVRLRGRVDRLERDAAGRLVVVDLKTGKRKPPADEMDQNPQLAAYQLAVESGGFPQGDQAGGAMLVQVGGTTRSYAAQRQSPLSEAEDPGWIAATVGTMAERMHGAEFTARAGDQCRMCDVKSSCPLQPEGRQVTQ